MIRFLALCALLLAASGVHGVKLWSLPATNVTSYTVDLGAPAETRWNSVISTHALQINATLAFLKQVIPPRWLPIAVQVAGLLDERFPRYGPEIRGIAKAAGLPLGDIVLLNLLYDLTVKCTSIVVSAPDGVVYHGRNLDYDLPDVLRPLVVQVSFVNSAVSGNQTLFAATTFAGMVGILTGVGPQRVSLSVDERDADSGEVWENLVELIVLKNARPVTFLIRDILEDGHQYDAALSQAILTPILAPVYIIIGGLANNQGAVVTRYRLYAEDVWSLSTKEANSWYRVESNYDHWLPDPPGDDRRTVAEGVLNKLGRTLGASPSGLWSTLGTYPVVRSETIYTTLMCPTTGDITTWTRWDTRPYGPN